MTDLSTVAIVLAAHGDRGSAERNAVLSAHTAKLRERRVFGSIGYGVLNGEPQLSAALLEANQAQPALVLVYPFFMSGGYFVTTVIPDRITSVLLACPLTILEPLGLDPALPGLLLRRALQTAVEAGLTPSRSNLLIVAHGSKAGRASAKTANAIAAKVRADAPFASVTTAFIEEAPFIADSLREAQKPTIVAGLFSGEGMHGHDDVASAMRTARVPCAYTRPIGGDPEVTALIEAALMKALAA